MPGIGRLIVGTSGSPGSLLALRYGEGLARAHGAVLVPVLAWNMPGGDRDWNHAPPYLRQACRERACQQLRDALIAVWGGIPHDPLVQPHLERGAAGWVLVSLARSPGDVLIIGAGRRGALARMAFSKVARYCLAHAQCPVVAIPPPALASELRHARLARMFPRRPLTAEQIVRGQPKPAS
jgi:nucleotide-binding universal stress UspA family protein